MASTSWGAEPGSNFPQVTIGLDTPYYGGLSATNIVGAPHMMGMEVQITFDSKAGARIAMPDILQQLRDAGAIHGSFTDTETGATVY